MINVDRVLELAGKVKKLKIALDKKEKALESMVSNGELRIKRAYHLRKPRRKYKLSFYVRNKIAQRMRERWANMTQKERGRIGERISKGHRGDNL